MISDKDKIFLKEEGYLLIKGFFDYENDIAPIQRVIYDVIGMVAKPHGLNPKIARDAIASIKSDAFQASDFCFLD